MRSCRHYLTIATMVVCCCGCSENSFHGNSVQEDETTIEAAAEPTATVDDQLTEVVSVSENSQSSEDLTAQRVGGLFESVLPTLDQTRELVDRHASLPDNSRIPFRLDKQSNSAEINELLDQAIEVLGVSEVSDYRQQIRDANQAISVAHQNIADYRRQRVSADWAKNQSQLDKMNPFELSKESLDEQIVNAESEIETQAKLLVELKQSFAAELTKIGVEIDEAGVESLLSSVSGDDIVTMAVVFDNIKLLTSQFQNLTEESGEALDVSKRYYGMYVVMIHVMDRIQKTFVRDINEKHIPKLNDYSSQADENIEQAQALIDMDGGDRKSLQANIESNKLTRETATLYIEYLQRNAELIAAENKRAQKNLATAMNTYSTVKLSSDVATLLNTGRRDFEALMRLQIPALREFSNDAIRQEFQRMTSELRDDT